MAPSPSPVGMKLIPKYRVGKKIGSGAQASVHLLEPTAAAKEKNPSLPTYAVKICPVPSKITKSGQSEPEINERSIRKEFKLYNNQFPKLRDEGMVASMPFKGGIQPFDTKYGFTYLILELMDADFWTIAPALAKTKSKSGSIDIGPIAERLMTMVEAIHDTQHLLVDIKPENFMLVAASSKKAATAESLAALVRVLDLGLFQMYNDHCGHRPNETGGDVQGTPLYASLNLHNGETPSRRDDVESLIYVIMELVIRTQAAVSGTVATYERNNNTPTYLPWSQEKSDKATGAVKRTMVENPKSDLYRRMPAEAAKILFECLQIVQSTDYNKTPLYADIADLLVNLAIPAATAASKKKAPPAAKRAAPATAASKKKAAAAAAALQEPSPPAKRAASASAASKKKKAAVLQEPASTPTRRSLRSAVAAAPIAAAARSSTRYAMEEDSSSDEEESPPKVRKTENYAVMDVDEEDEDNDIDEESEDNFYDADEPEEMDVDMDMEASSPDENRKPPAKTLQQGITLSFKKGPLQGQVFNMFKGEKETVIVGSNPVSKANASVLKILDDTLGASHVKFQIENPRKKHWRVQVTNLKPKNGGTTIGPTAVPPGKMLVAMPGQTIHLGQSQVLVIQYKGAKANYVVAEPERTPSRRKRNVAEAIDNSPQVVEDTKPAVAPMQVVKKNATARIVVTEGPHTGEEFFLGKGGSKKILFGTNPSTKAKDVDVIALPQANNMKANHARLDFAGNKQCMKINVTNVSGGDTLINVDPVKKDRAAFAGQTITMGDTVMRVESLSS